MHMHALQCLNFLTLSYTSHIVACVHIFGGRYLCDSSVPPTHKHTHTLPLLISLYLPPPLPPHTHPPLSCPSPSRLLPSLALYVSRAVSRTLFCSLAPLLSFSLSFSFLLLHYRTRCCGRCRLALPLTFALALSLAVFLSRTCAYSRRYFRLTIFISHDMHMYLYIWHIYTELFDSSLTAL